MIYLKHQIFVKAVHVLQQNITCSRTFLKLVLFEDQREPSILSCRVLFSQSSCSHIFFQGCSIYSIDILQPSILSGAIWNR